MRLRPVARPAKRMPRSARASVNAARSTSRYSASKVAAARPGPPSGAMRYANREVPPYTRAVASVTSRAFGTQSSDPRRSSKRYSFTPARGL